MPRLLSPAVLISSSPAAFSRLICPRSLHVQRGGAGLFLRGPRRLLRAAPPPIHHQELGRSRRPLRQFCILGCAPYLARKIGRACIHAKDRVPLSVDTCAEADSLGVTDRVVEEHRSRVERWLCRAIEARVSISSCLQQLSQTHQTQCCASSFAG